MRNHGGRFGFALILALVSILVCGQKDAAGARGGRTNAEVIHENMTVSIGRRSIAGRLSEDGTRLTYFVDRSQLSTRCGDGCDCGCPSEEQCSDDVCDGKLFLHIPDSDFMQVTLAHASTLIYIDYFLPFQENSSTYRIPTYRLKNDAYAILITESTYDLFEAIIYIQITGDSGSEPPAKSTPAPTPTETPTPTPTPTRTPILTRTPSPTRTLTPTPTSGTPVPPTLVPVLPPTHAAQRSPTPTPLITPTIIPILPPGQTPEPASTSLAPKSTPTPSPIWVPTPPPEPTVTLRTPTPAPNPRSPSAPAARSSLAPARTPPSWLSADRYDPGSDGQSGAWGGLTKAEREERLAQQYLEFLALYDALANAQPRPTTSPIVPVHEPRTYPDR